ncbi:hypothetical protein ACFLS1_08800 [Verrucomicrobiota bacterium]
MNKMNNKKTAVILVACLAIVGFWEVMSARSRRPFKPFRFTADDIKTFSLNSSQWSVKSIPINSSKIEPNILALKVKKPHTSTAPIFSRLAHGYNMPDCMRLKGYSVELITNSALPASSLARHSLATTTAAIDYQLWRLTSSTKDVSIWITSVLRAGDFQAIDYDVRQFAFPKTGDPRDSQWQIQGISLKSFRHPIRNFSRLLRSKWNSSRCDLLVFLNLKQAAWASDELFVLVSCLNDLPGKYDKEQVMKYLFSAHEYIYTQLYSWREEQKAGM